MKKSKLFLIIILITLSITSFMYLKKSNKKHEPIVKNQIVSGIYPGEAKTSTRNVKIEIELEENVIKHIELLSSNGSIEFDKMSVVLFDNIIKKNSLSSISYSEDEQVLIDAINDALTNAGISKEFLKDISNEYEKEIQNEYNCDLIILGAGGAGLTAAIEARSLGIENVIVLEKMSFTGGNTRMSGGGYSAPCNWVQKEEGIVGDSVEWYFNDIYKGGYKTGDVDLISVIAENSLADAEWLKDFVGVRFKNKQIWYEGHSYKRTLKAEGDGSQLIDTLVKKAENMGVEIHYTTKATQLITNEIGKVIGVKAEKGGESIIYNSNMGVILATGGFSANEELLKKYDTQWSKYNIKSPTTNSPAIMGDGILMAEEIGAALVDMNYIQLYPISNPATGNFYLIDYARLNDNAILVNKEGHRFVNELETRDKLSNAAINQTGNMIYEIIDSTTSENMNLETEYKEEIQRCIDQGVLVKGSLQECASFMGIPLSALRNTINNYNNMAKIGVDTDFGRKTIRYIDNGPYYMFSSIVSIHHTMGGVKIDTDARVIDVDGNPIPYLYAAGEVTGGIHGANRLGSVALADSVVFGRISAQSAYNYYNKNN